jgi:hypothetical protein
VEKDYNGKAFELFSTGIERLFFKQYNTKQNDDFYSFINGLFLGYNTFTIKGKIGEEEYTLHYENDKLTGDEEAISRAIEENKKDHGFLGVIPGGSDKKYLENENAAACLIEKYVFEEVVFSEDDWYEGDDEDTVY